MKYISFRTSELQQVIDVLVETCKSSIWYVRAAALVYLQALYVRHPFTLTSDEVEQLQGIAISLLSDSQIEVDYQMQHKLLGKDYNYDSKLPLLQYTYVQYIVF